MYIKCFHVFKDVTFLKKKLVRGKICKGDEPVITTLKDVSFLKKKLVRGKICKGDEPVITTLKDVSFLNLFKPKGNESVFTT